MSETRLFIYGPPNDNEGPYYLMTEAGEVLASHWCSSVGFARGDLESRRPERQKEWRERFGEYRVLMAGEEGVTRETLLTANKAFAPEAW